MYNFIWFACPALALFWEGLLDVHKKMSRTTLRVLFTVGSLTFPLPYARIIVKKKKKKDFIY